MDVNPKLPVHTPLFFFLTSFPIVYILLETENSFFLKSGGKMVSVCLLVQLLCSVIPNQTHVFGTNGELLMKPSTYKYRTPSFPDSVPGFRPSVQIDDSTLMWCRGPFLHILDDNTIYALLQSGPGSGLPRYIRFASSTDTGQTWTNPNTIIRYDPNTIICYPSLSVGQDDGINVIWTEPYNSGILFSRSNDSGLTWSDTVSVDDGLPSGYRRLYPDIVCKGDTLIACWTEGPPSPQTWYPWVSFSNDSGATWFGENQISCVPVNTSTNWPRPYIRFDPLFKMYYVLWPCNDGEVYVAHSPDGTSWQYATVTIDNVENASSPSMDVGQDGTVYVVWYESRYASFDTDIFLSMSTDSGVTWSSSILVNDRASIADNQYEPHISLDIHQTIHISWIECVPFGSMTHAYYTQSTDNGSTWVEPNLVVTDIPYTITPSVPYSLTVASDTNSYAYIGWTYDFYGTGGGVLNFFSTNCPENVGVKEKKDHRLKTSDIRLTASPNPFTKVTRFEVLGSSKNSELQIYDVSGRKIKNLSVLSSQFSVPSYVWDGRDDAGKELSPGIYLLKVNGKSAGKVLKIK
jgi:hypothetical protein